MNDNQRTEELEHKMTKSQVDESLITTRVDFEKDGKQRDFLRLPHSVSRSAYGWLPSPIVSIKNGSGPTVLLMAGVHGDEFEGQVALSKLVASIEPQDVAGRIIILPMANYPAAAASERTSPIDDVNMNRVFPGSARGSLTEQIAHYIETQLMSLADYVFDFHSGGSSLHYLPTTLVLWSDDEDVRNEQIEFATVFGSPYACYFRGAHGGRSSSAAALRKDAKGVTFELGGSGRVSPDVLRLSERGIVNLLRHLGVLRNVATAEDVSAPRVVSAMPPESYVFSLAGGVFEPVAALGDDVVSGQLAGRIHKVDTPWDPPTDVFFDTAGVVLCQRSRGRTQRGDCLYHLGCPLSHA